MSNAGVRKLQTRDLFGSALGFGAVLLVVLTGGAYLAWRDTFEGPRAPVAPAGIEV